ncbi:MAG TPA: 3-phosphoshikimate 1-carboxyvinyltransferase [Gemmatimonadota bacterium]|nr:3-phosphoshikimate 1-carboxyvinyltransferase [Gemmatimonadota bacterium]
MPRLEPLGRVRARLRVPGDKSISHRALLLNALAEGEARVRGLAPGKDVASSAAALRALGRTVAPVPGGGVRVAGGGAWRATHPIDCGNSGTTARLLLGILAPRAEGVVTLTGDASLSARPMARVVEPLRAMGAVIEGEGRLPLAVSGGHLRGVEHRIPVASAQVKSALLLAGLAADGETAVEEPAPSRDHTERMLAAMGAAIRREGRRTVVGPGGLQAIDVDIPGDLSSAAFFLALAAARPGSEVVVEDVGLNPTRAGFLDWLSEMGAEVEIELRSEDPEPRGDVRVVGRPLRGIEVRPETVPRGIDELSLLAVVATRAEGETRISGAAELKVKESDRIATIAAGLSAMGARIEVADDGFRVSGPTRLTGGAVDAAGDHRIAMALAVAAALAVGPTDLAGAEWIDVSYPGFLEELAALGRGAPPAARP